MTNQEQGTEHGAATEELATIEGENPENQSRRDALKKLGKYGTVSATVTAVVYSGINGNQALAMSPITPPPPPGF